MKGQRCLALFSPGLIPLAILIAPCSLRAGNAGKSRKIAECFERDFSRLFKIKKKRKGRERGGELCAALGEKIR